MRFKTVLLFLACIALPGLYIVFKLGENHAAKKDVSIGLPALVRIHRFLENGNARDARDFTQMLISSKLYKYDSLNRDLIFKATYGKQAFERELFQKALAEAIEIRKQTATNLIWVDPAK